MYNTDWCVESDSLRRNAALTVRRRSLQASPTRSLRLVRGKTGGYRTGRVCVELRVHATHILIANEECHEKYQYAFHVICTFCMIVTGIGIIVYAGPCYIQTSYIRASEKKCYPAQAILPIGQACPSILYPNREDDKRYPTQCGAGYQREHYLGIGTSGNERSGHMEQNSISRACYSRDFCKLSGPILDLGLPIVDYIYFRCDVDRTIPDSSTASSFEPTGADCHQE